MKFQTLFEESLDGIVLLNPATQQFIEYNHNAYEMYGYSKEEFAILTPKDLDAIHNEKQIIATQQNIIENGWDRFITKHKTQNGVLKDVRNDLYEKTVELPLAYFSEKRKGNSNPMFGRENPSRHRKVMTPKGVCNSLVEACKINNISKTTILRYLKNKDKVEWGYIG